MADDELVQVTLRLKDARKFIADGKLSEKAIKRIGDETAHADRKGRLAAVGFGMFTKAVDLLKVAVIGTVSVLGTLVTLGLGKAVMASSNLTEALNKTNVVFASSAAGVIEWSKGTAMAFGISQRAALDAAGVFGNMLVPMGFMPSKAAGMSKQLVELAGDMASFNNASPEEVLDALRSGLSGETEPLRKFGVFLSDAVIQQEAMRLGFKKVNGQLPQVAKTTAAYNIVLRDTHLQQGDVARSAKTSLAVSWSKLKAVAEDSGAGIGKGLLQPLINVVQIGTNMVATFNRARGAGASFGFAIATALDGATGGGTRFRTMFVRIQSIIQKVIGYVQAKVIPALVSFGHEIVEGFKPLMPFVKNVWLPLMKGIAIGIIGAIVGAWKIIWPILKLWFRILGWVGTKADGFQGKIEGLGKIIGFVFAGPILKGIGALAKVGGALGMVGRAAGATGGLIIKMGEIFGVALGFIGRIVGRALGLVTSLFGRFAPAAGVAFQLMGQNVRAGIGRILGFLEGIGSKFVIAGKSIWTHLVEGLKGAFGSGMGFVGDLAHDLANSVIGFLNTAIPDHIPIPGSKDIPLPKNPIPKLAHGGTLTSGGTVMVGDGGNGSGAEYVDLPRGARVRPLSADERSVHRSAGGAGASSGSGRTLRIEVPLHIDGKLVGSAVADVTDDDLARR